MMPPYDSAGSVGSLLLASLAVMGSPGPSTTSLVAATVAFGVRRSLAYGAGLVAGAVAVLLATATGITAILLAMPVIHWVLLIAATGYILWLAYRLATAPPHAERSTPDRSPTFADGVILGVVNPKAWIAIAAVFAGSRLAGDAIADAVLKITLLSVMVVLIHGMWLLAGRLLAPALRHPRRARAVNVILAGLLVGAGVLALLP